MDFFLHEIEKKVVFQASFRHLSGKTNKQDSKKRIKRSPACISNKDLYNKSILLHNGLSVRNKNQQTKDR